MKTLFSVLFLLGFLVFNNCAVAQQEGDTTETPPPPPPDQVFTIVEKMPIFGNCDTNLSNKELNECSSIAINKYVTENIEYPKQAMKDGLQGTVYCSFIINKSGEVTEIKILKGVKGAEILDQEAIRVINTMPNWKPGTQRGKRVKVKYVLPVRFALK